MKSSVSNINQNIQGGTPCFNGTRVPVSSLLDYIEGGYTVDYFLSQFPSVQKAQVMTLIHDLKNITTNNLEQQIR